MADGGWQAKECTQEFYRGGNAKTRSANAFADLAKGEDHCAKNGKLEGIFDRAVDGDVHIEIAVEQKREQKDQ